MPIFRVVFRKPILGKFFRIHPKPPSSTASNIAKAVVFVGAPLVSIRMHTLRRITSARSTKIRTARARVALYAETAQDNPKQERVPNAVSSRPARTSSAKGKE